MLGVRVSLSSRYALVIILGNRHYEGETDSSGSRGPIRSSHVYSASQHLLQANWLNRYVHLLYNTDSWNIIFSLYNPAHSNVNQLHFVVSWTTTPVVGVTLNFSSAIGPPGWAALASNFYLNCHVESCDTRYSVISYNTTNRSVMIPTGASATFSVTLSYIPDLFTSFIPFTANWYASGVRKSVTASGSILVSP